MTAPDLQPLFEECILEQVELDSGFADHGSSVYRVRTAREHAVARAFRDESAASPFWCCLRTLFGIDPRVASEAAAIYPLLADVSPFGVPRVRRAADAGGRTWLVVDLMPGAPLGTFDELSDAGLVGLGRGLASIHGRRFATLGNPSGSIRFAPSELPQRLARALDTFAGAHGEAPVPDHLRDDLRAAIAGLPPPAGGALVLPDLFPPQLLQRDGHVVAIVDLDAYVVGPRELDLVGLEYFLDARAAALVATGYEEVAPLPPLRDVRRPYRWLLWVLTMNPMALHVERWLAWPKAFA
jgi:hypothetical protein